MKVPTMLINFFFTLRAAKLPVSVKEYLTLLEALKLGVLDDDGGPSVDKFYFLARTALVKDEAHFDKFDRAFGAYFQGVELLTDFTKDVPLEWLRKNLELELSPEEKAATGKLVRTVETPPEMRNRYALSDADVTGAPFGKELSLTAHDGKPRTLADFKGKVVVLFFGVARVPDSEMTVAGSFMVTHAMRPGRQGGKG